MDSRRSYVLTIQCPDRVGIVAAVTGFLAAHGGWIVEAKHHADTRTGLFFMRQEILAETLEPDLTQLEVEFAAIATEFEMTWRLTDSARKRRVVVLVSRQDHCLAEILYRWRTHEYDIDIPCVISNHEKLRDYVEWHGIPYHHVPVTPETKAAAFKTIERLYEEAGGDTMVLARYMQILPAGMCRRHFGSIINIHHSFLPSFVGARPYHRAHERGVKLIGATSHYVTPELDAGPIIDQDVIRVNHGHSVRDMIRLGKSVEKMVLARALHHHLEDRVMIDGNKTVVLE